MTITSLDRILLLNFLCCITIFLLLSCSGEKPADIKTQEISETKSEKPSEELKTTTRSNNKLYSVKIAPTDASRKSTIEIIPEGFKLEDAMIEWLVNGNVDRDSTSSEFNTKRALKGESVQARVRVNNSVLYSNIIYIKNAPPELTKVKLLPEVFRPGDTLSIEAETIDADEDSATILYEWTKNGEPAGNESRIEGTVKRGDKINVKITPFDGEDYGQSIILDREIANIPPVIIDHKDFKFDGKVYTYQVRAEDPDEDTLTYSLKSDIEGIRINSETGVITWDVPKDFIGEAAINISVTDGHGGEATQQLTFIINPPK